MTRKTTRSFLSLLFPFQIKSQDQGQNCEQGSEDPGLITSNMVIAERWIGGGSLMEEGPSWFRSARPPISHFPVHDSAVTASWLQRIGKYPNNIGSSSNNSPYPKILISVDNENLFFSSSFLFFPFLHFRSTEIYPRLSRFEECFLTKRKYTSN